MRSSPSYLQRLSTRVLRFVRSARRALAPSVRVVFEAVVRFVEEASEIRVVRAIRCHALISHERAQSVRTALSRSATTFKQVPCARRDHRRRLRLGEQHLLGAPGSRRRACPWSTAFIASRPLQIAWCVAARRAGLRRLRAPRIPALQPQTARHRPYLSFHRPRAPKSPRTRRASQHAHRLLRAAPGSVLRRVRSNSAERVVGLQPARPIAPMRGEPARINRQDDSLVEPVYDSRALQTSSQQGRDRSVGARHLLL